MSLCSIVGLSIFTNFYNDNIENILAYLLFTNGISGMTGPLFASGLFDLEGYNFIFYVVGTIIAISCLCFCWILDSKIDQVDQTEVKPTNKISLISLMSWNRLLFAAISAGFSEFMGSGFNSVLAVRLKQFNLSQFEISAVFALWFVF